MTSSPLLSTSWKGPSSGVHITAFEIWTLPIGWSLAGSFQDREVEDVITGGQQETGGLEDQRPFFTGMGSSEES